MIASLLFSPDVMNEVHLIGVWVEALLREEFIFLLEAQGLDKYMTLGEHLVANQILEACS